VSHIINYDVPEFCDDYVHRVGRTGRLSTGDKGYAFTFVTKEEGSQLTSIEMRINLLLPQYKLDEPSPTKRFAAAKTLTAPEPQTEEVGAA